MIHEDSAAVHTPECHAQGLVPLTNQNPKLQIEKRAKGYGVAYLSHGGWMGQGGDFSQFLERKAQAESLFRALISWLDEARRLGAKGLATKSYSLELAIQWNMTAM